MVDLKSTKPENFWYVIGYIATDGHLSKDGRHINITSKDEDHIVKIKNTLRLNVKIGKKTRGKSKDKIYSQIQFSDVKFYKYLLGIVLSKRSLSI